MDKVTRMLILYRRLMRGELISKSLYALEFEINERSFDRDIQDMRAFLSETFSNTELVYDEDLHGYHLINLHLKREISVGECYVLAKLLLDGRPLRTDDQSEVVQILLSQLSPAARERVVPVLFHAPAPPENRRKASMKLVEDLLFSIERKHQIALHFRDESVDSDCAPFSIEFRGRDTYLVAWTIAAESPSLYPLDAISSYTPAKQPYILNERQKTGLQKLVDLVCTKGEDLFSPFIYHPERRTHDNF